MQFFFQNFKTKNTFEFKRFKSSLSRYAHRLLKWLNSCLALKKKRNLTTAIVNVKTAKRKNNLTRQFRLFSFFIDYICSENCHFRSKLLKTNSGLVWWRWVLGGGVGVPWTVNPLHDGLTADAEAQKAVWSLISETLTIRPLRLAVSERFP